MSPTPGRIAVRADFTAIAETFAVTEVGLFARTGAAGAEWLAGYWCGAAASDAIARADPAATLIVAGIVEIAASAAEITVTLAANVQVGAPGSASAAREGLVELATLDEARAGTDTTRAVTPQALADAIPPGVILDYAGAGPIPAGWLACTGQLVSRTTYARLYAAIGTTWGAGDGRTTFAVPDLRRRVRAGASGAATPRLGNTVGSTGGSETHTLTTSEMPAHTHGDGTLGAAGGGSHLHSAGTLATDAVAAHTHGAGTLRTAAAGSHTHGVSGVLGYSGSGGSIGARGPINFSGRPATSQSGGHTHDVTGSTGSAGRHSHDVTGSTGSVGSHTHNVAGSTGSAGAGVAHPILQPTAVVAAIIRY